MKMVASFFTYLYNVITYTYMCMMYSYPPPPPFPTHPPPSPTHPPLSTHSNSDWTSDDGDESSEFTCSANTAADILHLLSSLEGCEEVLTQLLQQKNLEGYTPFMAAVAYKVSEEIMKILYNEGKCFALCKLLMDRTKSSKSLKIHCKNGEIILILPPLTSVASS